MTSIVVVVESLSRVQLFVTPCTVASQAPLSMEFSRQEYWSGLPFPTLGVFLTQGSNPGLLHCRQILYCLNQQGSDFVKLCELFTVRGHPVQWACGG